MASRFFRPIGGFVGGDAEYLCYECVDDISGSYLIAKNLSTRRLKYADVDCYLSDVSRHIYEEFFPIGLIRKRLENNKNNVIDEEQRRKRDLFNDKLKRTIGRRNSSYRVTYGTSLNFVINRVD